MIFFYMGLLAIPTLPEGITGVWDLYRDDDKGDQVLSGESLLVFPDGRLRIASTRRVFNIAWTIEGDNFVFIFDKNGKKDRVKRPFVLEGDSFKLKNEKTGYVWYRRSGMMLPEKGTMAEWREFSLGDFKIKIPGDWEVIKPNDDSQRIIMEKTGQEEMAFAIFGMIYAGGWEVAGEKTKDLLVGVAASVGLDPTVLRHKKDPLFGFEGGYMMFEHKPPGEHLLYAAKSFQIDDGRLMLVAVMHPADLPPKDFEKIMDTVRIDGKALQKKRNQ